MTAAQLGAQHGAIHYHRQDQGPAATVVTRHSWPDEFVRLASDPRNTIHGTSWRPLR